MVFDAPEVEEVAFTLVTNKKGKGKAKVSSLPSTDSRSKISLISRAPSVPKTVTASAAAKLAVTCTFSAITLSKPAQPQSAPLPVSLDSKPKPKVKSFAQAAKANGSTQQAPRFAPASFYEDFLHLLQLKEAFPNLPQATTIFMYQASLGSVEASQGSLSHPTVSRTLKITTQRPTRHQVLILLTPAAAEIVVANALSSVTRAWSVLALSLELSLCTRHGIVYPCLPTLLPL